MLRQLSLLLCLLLPLLANAEEAGRYAQELIEQSRQLDLGTHPQWLKLGHYLPDKRGEGYASVADSTNFFNAGNGKYDPQQELEATLQAFFSSVVETDKVQHPQCQFIARYQWLKQQLHFDPARLREEQCPRFEAWYQAINPQQVTLIFPTAYMNNPSSMFGHTLLRIDTPEQTERTRLISYAINFAADTGESNGIIFAIKGLTGGYPGTFSIMPYYEKVKEYNDLENRDIWEYQLTFTPAETRRLLEHVWELGPVYFDYYFFDENCSYQLLSVLDVARPGLNLTEQFPSWAIPSDTLRAVMQQEGLLKKAVYRPSGATRLQHSMSRMSHDERQLALDLATGTATKETPRLQSLSPERRALVLDVAYDYLQYMFVAEDWSRSEVGGRSLALLKARSQIDVQDSRTDPPPPEVRPEQGHLSARLAVSLVDHEGQRLVETRLRPAYHDLLDPLDGYRQGAAISFFDLVLQRDLDHPSNSRLERFTLVDIVSLSPRNDFFSPLSWQIAGGWERLPEWLHPDTPLAPYLEGGAGPSYQLTDGLLLTLMLQGKLQLQEDLENEHSSALGGKISLLWNSQRLNLQLSSRYYRSQQPDGIDWASHTLESAVTLSPNLALRLGGSVEGPVDALEQRVQMGLHWYF